MMARRIFARGLLGLFAGGAGALLLAACGRSSITPLYRDQIVAAVLGRNDGYAEGMLNYIKRIIGFGPGADEQSLADLVKLVWNADSAAILDRFHLRLKDPGLSFAANDDERHGARLAA